jgi:transcriptional regulator with XRE-family HTH domain
MMKRNTSKLFPGCLEATMQRNRINQVQIAASTGIAVSRINNYLQGKYRTIKPDHIARIIEHVTALTFERAELVKTYLLDLLPTTAKPLLELKPVNSHGKEFESWYLQRNRLPGEFAHRFETLYKLCVSQPAVRARTSMWIDMVEETLK